MPIPLANEFPVDKLVSTPKAVRAQSVISSMPPEDLDDDDDLETTDTVTIDSDAMDLDTPEKATAMWTPRKRPDLLPTPASQIPSPFHGHLPPEPVSQAHRLRNPPNKPSFQRAPESRQKAFTESIMGKSSLGDDKSIDGSSPLRPTDIQMAPPRFFASRQEETGLESLFTGLVSLSDEPSEVRQPHPSPLASSPAARSASVQIAHLSSLIAFMLSCGTIWLLSAGETSSQKPYLTVIAISIVLLDSLWQLHQSLSRPRQIWQVSDIIMYAGAVAASGTSLYLGHNPWYTSDLETGSVRDGEKLLLGLFALQKGCTATRAAFEWTQGKLGNGNEGKSDSPQAG